MMLPSAPSKAPSGPAGLDPRRLAKIVRRLALPFLLGATWLFLYWFGALRVPEGMDTIPGIPPGSLCVIDKRRGSARPGDEVFVALSDGSCLLSRLVAVAADGSLVVRNDNPGSQLPDSRQFGPLPASSLRGRVLVVFAGQGEPGEAIRGR